MTFPEAAEVVFQNRFKNSGGEHDFMDLYDEIQKDQGAHDPDADPDDK